MTKARQLKLLMDSAHLFAKNKVSNDPSFMSWWKIVKTAHFRGFLYVGFEKDTVDMAVIAYRIPRIHDRLGDSIPEREEGNILYVCSAVSNSQDQLKLFRLFRWYLRETPNVSMLVYHYRNSNELKVIPLRSRNGKEIISER